MLCFLFDPHPHVIRSPAVNCSAVGIGVFLPEVSFFWAASVWSSWPMKPQLIVSPWNCDRPQNAFFHPWVLFNGVVPLSSTCSLHLNLCLFVFVLEGACAELFTPAALLSALQCPLACLALLLCKQLVWYVSAGQCLSPVLASVSGLPSHFTGVALHLGF